MQSLIDQQQYVSAVLHGNGAVDNGPVPTLPQTDFLTPLLRQGPYPYNVARAKSLLSQHGWTVKPGGTSTCAKPGSGSGQCGAGITAGQALSMNLVYSAGLPLPELAG